jgi:hypothetical protein
VTSMGNAITILRSDTVRILPIHIVDEPGMGTTFPADRWAKLVEFVCGLSEIRVVG